MRHPSLWAEILYVLREGIREVFDRGRRRGKRDVQIAVGEWMALHTQLDQMRAWLKDMDEMVTDLQVTQRDLQKALACHHQMRPVGWTCPTCRNTI